MDVAVLVTPVAVRGPGRPPMRSSTDSGTAGSSPGGTTYGDEEPVALLPTAHHDSGRTTIS
jgi:hypothetical protein